MSGFEGVRWRKSSYSSEANACVEVANTVGAVGIRDSKAAHLGGISVSRAAWAVFVRLLC